MKRKQFLECPVILSQSSRWHCCIKTTHQLGLSDWRSFSQRTLPPPMDKQGKKWIMKRLFPSVVQYGWCSWENGFLYLNMYVFDNFIHAFYWVWKVTASSLPLLARSLSMPKFNKLFWFQKPEVRNPSCALIISLRMIKMWSEKLTRFGVVAALFLSLFMSGIVEWKDHVLCTLKSPHPEFVTWSCLIPLSSAFPVWKKWNGSGNKSQPCSFKRLEVPFTQPGSVPCTGQILNKWWL